MYTRMYTCPLSTYVLCSYSPSNSCGSPSKHGEVEAANRPSWHLRRYRWDTSCHKPQVALQHQYARFLLPIPDVLSVRSRLIEALVDYKKRFLDLEIGWSGSVGDCRIFENSYLNGKYEEEPARIHLPTLVEA